MTNLYVAFVAKHVETGQMVNGWGVLKDRAVPKTGPELQQVIDRVNENYGVQEMTISYMHEIDGKKEIGRIDVVNKADQVEIEADKHNGSSVYLEIDGNYICIIGQSFGEPDPERSVILSRDQYRQIRDYLETAPETKERALS